MWIEEEPMPQPEISGFGSDRITDSRFVSSVSSPPNCYKCSEKGFADGFAASAEFSRISLFDSEPLLRMQKKPG